MRASRRGRGSMKIIAAAICLAALPGCAEYYERESQARYEGYQNRCSSYGFTPGSQPYANCMMGLDQQETANRQALVGAYLANQPHPQPYVLPMPAPVQPVQQSAPRTCQSTVNGQVINTTCY